MIFGLYLNGIFGRQYIRSDEPLSITLIAPPGSGKTAAIVVPNLLSCTNSMFINDVKGELWDMTSKQRAKMGAVGLFAPTLGLGIEKSLSFNPFAKNCLPMSFPEQIDFVDRLVSILYPTDENVSDAAKYFNTNAKNMFMFWAMVDIYQNGFTSLPRIYEKAAECTDQKAAIAQLLDTEEFDEYDYIVKKGNTLLNMKDEDFGGSTTSFTNMLEPFNRPNIRQYFEGSSFTYKDFRQAKPFSLYIGIPPRDMATMAPILQLMAQYLTLELMSDRALFKKQRVTFVLDEFARLGFVPDLVNAPELARGCNMNFIYCCQSENQIKKIYHKGGSNPMQGLIDVCEYTLVYTQNDQSTAEQLSKTIGKTTKKKKSVSKKFGDLTGSSNVSTEAVPFVTDQDLLNLSNEKMLVVKKGFKKRPVICNKPWFFKDKVMKGLIGAYNNLILSEDIDIPEQGTEFIPPKLQNEFIHPNSTTKFEENSQSDINYDVDNTELSINENIDDVLA